MGKPVGRSNAGGESRGQERASEVRGKNFEVDFDELAGFNFKKLQAFNTLTVVNDDEVTFIEADDEGAGGNYETDPDLSEKIEDLLDEYGIAGTLKILQINGNTADTFRAIWETLDDGYVSGGPFDLEINTAFVDLGLAYIEYLEEGGEALTFDTVKYAEGSRDQNMHDNILGNVTTAALTQRGLLELYGDMVPQEYLDRPYYSGNASAEGGAAHDGVRAFDYDKGWDREDYIEQSFGEVDARATNNGDGIEMIFGDGNSTDNYAITRHEGAGVELAIKAKERYVGDYDQDQITVNEDGTVTYTVATGDADAVRSSWNIDWAATVTEAGDDSVDDLEFKLLLDTDPGLGEVFLDISASGVEYYGEGSGWNGTDLQNSWNYGFFPGFDASVEGLYTAKLEAYDDGELIAVQTIYVEAMDVV